jgi:ribosomal protein S18 acetylase RimI-like enzyme
VSEPTVPRALVWATDIDVMAADRTVERRSRYLVVRSPSHPEFYWGNLLVLDAPPADGDRPRWERWFEAEFGSEPRVRHRTFAWDTIDGSLGRAREDFVSLGYELEETVGLLATPDTVGPHPRENRDADGELWERVVELQVASRDERFEENLYRAYCRQRLADRRVLFRAGRGAWFVALYPGEGEVVGSCGVVVTAGRGRFQAVDTAAAHRRKGICSRLVVEAADRTARLHGARRLVIAADPDYHALGLYESLGFRRAERVAGVCQRPAGEA